MTVDAAIAEHATTTVPTSEPKANADRSDRSNIVLHGDVEETPPAPPSDADHLVAILMVRPEIKSVSDLANKSVAIDDWQSASASTVRTAIAAAGAAEVQMSEGDKTLAIDRVISGEVPAAVLTLTSPEAAQTWPQMTGFKIFRIPLSSSGSVVR